MGNFSYFTRKKEKKHMKKFTVQYSVPTNTRIAVSDWIWREKTISALSTNDAIDKFNKEHQHLGTWMILDCWQID